jgi:hypothetical protein
MIKMLILIYTEEVIDKNGNYYNDLPSKKRTIGDIREFNEHAIIIQDREFKDLKSTNDEKHFKTHYPLQ